MDKMTEKQTEIFQWIKRFIERNKYSPTYQEIGDAFKVTPNASHCHVQALEKKGFLTIARGIARGILIDNPIAKPGLSFKTHENIGLMELFVDGELITTWAYEDEPEYSFHEFEKIFWAGYNHGER